LAVAEQKIRKTGDALNLELVETPDVVANLGAIKTHQWMVAFALETEDRHCRAMQKLERKNCDLIVVNGPEAVDAAETSVEILDPKGEVVAAFSGGKREVGWEILQIIGKKLCINRAVPNPP
jgi:phosphopantothenoylcysteine decarboxylase/phosphopantothenate--cysteine ligase